MARTLLLVTFVAVCSVAFVAGNLWAGGTTSSTGTKTYKKHYKKPSDTLAKALNSSKKSLRTAKVSSKKSSSTLKSTRSKSISKKTSGTKAKPARKSGYLKSSAPGKASNLVYFRSPRN